MEEFIKNYWRNSMISSILLAIVGFILMINPVATSKATVIFFGVSILMVGIGHIISYVFKKEEEDVFNFEFFEGIICIFFGLLIGYNPHLVLESIAVVAGVWVVLNALIRLQIGLNVNTDFYKQMWIICLSMLGFILGILIITNPGGLMTAVPVLVGGFLFITEIVNIVEYLCIIHDMKLISKTVKKKAK